MLMKILEKNCIYKRSDKIKKTFNLYCLKEQLFKIQFNIRFPQER